MKENKKTFIFILNCFVYLKFQLNRFFLPFLVLTMDAESHLLLHPQRPYGLIKLSVGQKIVEKLKDLFFFSSRG